jgi:hypothetical protein
MGQKLGPGTVADLALPGSFVARVAGRILQAWFNERFRVVVDDTGAEQHQTPPPATATSELPAGAVRVQCPPPPVSPDAPAAPPPSRNFRWPPTDGALFPFESTGADATPLVAELSTLIARSLARDGLLLSAARALAAIRRTRAGVFGAEALSLLKQSGLPTDLLASFRPNGAHPGEEAVVDWLLTQLESSPPERLRPLLARIPFEFRASSAGFAALPDSGQVDPEVVRIQITRASYYAAPGDGGSFDILRQLLEKTRARLLVHAEQKHAAPLVRAMRQWPASFHDRLTLLVQDLPLSQWAQDCAKSGRLQGGRPATLTPRFASRGEETSQFVVGDSCVATALAAAGQTVIRSPLLFQGGNLLMVQEPSGQRTLLVGEAEVHRNRALGLSSDQALSALSTELGADRAVVLPAASIHLDYEVSARAHGGGVVALVNNTRAALRIMLNECVGALAAPGPLSDDQARDVRTQLDRGGLSQVLDLLWPVLARSARGPGQFPLSLADHFRRGEPDSGVGNFLRFLAALDVAGALSKQAARSPDPYLAAYLHAIERQEQDRSVMAQQLLALGWRVHPVPSFALGHLSINALNGIHTPWAFLIPAYGGLFAPLDAAALASISNAFDRQVEVVPVLSGESQRRDGAVHCSVSVLAGR